MVFRKWHNARLSLRPDPEAIPDPRFLDVVEWLRALWVRRQSVTPYQTVASALEQLEVRARITDRHDVHTDRALANVDRFLDLSRSYEIRGLKAFAEGMDAKWNESGARAVAGRPDAERDAVTP